MKTAPKTEAEQLVDLTKQLDFMQKVATEQIRAAAMLKAISLKVIRGCKRAKYGVKQAKKKIHNGKLPGRVRREVQALTEDLLAATGRLQYLSTAGHL